MFTCGAWVYTCGAIASTAGVDLSIPPVAPADVPALFRPRVGDIYLRWGRDVYLRCFGLFTYGLPSSRGGVYLRCGHLPAVLLGCLPPVGAEIVMPDGMGVYTSGGFAYTRREYV